jgi:hypothetical protein
VQVLHLESTHSPFQIVCRQHHSLEIVQLKD